MYQKEKGIWQKHLDFILLDLICFQVAYIVAFMLRHGFILPYSWEEYRNLGIIMALVELCAGFLMENYKEILSREALQELKKTILLITIVFMVVFTYLFVTKTTDFFSRAVFIEVWGIAIVLTYAVRLIWKTHVRRQLCKEEKLQNLVIVTTADRAEETIEGIQRKKYKDFRISGVILLENHEEQKEVSGIPVLAEAEGAVEKLQREVVDQVFIDAAASIEATRRIMDSCAEMGIPTHYNLEQDIAVEKDSIVQSFAGHTVLTQSMKFADPRALFFKRGIDILGGCVGILLTGVLTVFIGPIIFIQSPGPVFFSQERVGKNGRKFRIYKFRSMYPDAEERKKELMAQNKMQGLMFKMDDDPRIIPIGKFIRKTSLDEFPQFFNVLRGDMSLVGTRPPTVDEYEQYELHHRARLAAKPGLTGMWQISGRSDIIDFEQVVELDKQYIKEWSLGLDIKILFETVKVVVTRKGSA